MSAPSPAEVAAAVSTLGLPGIPLPDAVARSAVNAARLARDLATTGEIAWTLRTERLPEAREHDRDSFAAALAAGEADPEPVETLRIQDELATADRRTEALEVAATSSRQDVTAAIDAERDTWLPHLEADVTATTSRYLAAIAELRVAHDELSAAVGAEQWLRNPATNARGRRYLVNVPNEQDRHGHPLLVTDVLVTLASLTEIL